MSFPVFSKFFYSNLNAAEKKVYDKLLISWQCLNEKTTVRSTIGSVDFNKVFNALLNDIPEFYYVDFSQITITQSFSLVHISAKLKYSKNEVESDKKKIDSIVKKIIKSVGNNQILSIHDYMVNNIKYSSHFNDADVYGIKGALLNNEAVCEGYARTFKLFCDYLKIPCIVIFGTATDSNGKTEAHAWNIVRVKNQNYHMDVTWNRNYKHDGGIPLYYCVSDEWIQGDHYWNTAKWPACSVKGKVESLIVSINSPKDLKESISSTIINKKNRLLIRFSKRFENAEQVSKQIEMAIFSLGFNNCSGYGISYNKKLNCCIVNFKY